ncbi:MAG: S41 family peptidase, partial [Paramuribaculum sp.]|nr:S41 family peptidase [Paramuribaculum sp.]
MKSFFSRKAVFSTIIGLITLILGLFIGAKFLSKNNDDRLNKLNDIIGIIDNNYVDEVNVDSMLEVSIPDLLAKLDPHSEYIPARDLQNVNDELEGSFSGIGISFNMLNDTITIVEVIPGGPSEKVGLLAGDRIIAINDSSAVAPKWSTEKVIKNLKGPRGTEVKLEILRNNSAKPLEFTVIRDNVPVTSVDASYMLSDNTGYMKVNKFGRTTYAEFLNGLLSLKNQGAERLVIDLRGNGGGFMDVAILMANEFLAPGSPIVSARGRFMEEPIIRADGTGSFTDTELVVLLDEISASSSEIFAGAIQDNDRGLIVGRRSFGKGLVQNQFTLPDSSAMRLTVARYYT